MHVKGDNSKYALQCYACSLLYGCKTVENILQQLTFCKKLKTLTEKNGSLPFINK